MSKRELEAFSQSLVGEKGKRKRGRAPAWLGAGGIPTLIVRHGGGSNRRSAGDGCAYPGNWGGWEGLGGNVDDMKKELGSLHLFASETALMRWVYAIAGRCDVVTHELRSVSERWAKGRGMIGSYYSRKEKVIQIVKRKPKICL